MDSNILTASAIDAPSDSFSCYDSILTPEYGFVNTEGGIFGDKIRAEITLFLVKITVMTLGLDRRPSQW
jgi:hypothetical protein